MFAGESVAPIEMRTRWIVLTIVSTAALAACGGAASYPHANGGQHAGTATNPMESVKLVLQTPLRSGSLPLTLYVGADYCPYCASMRWPLVKALSRFGTFSGLGARQSTTGVDGFPSIATYDFNRVSYQSSNVAFQAVEIADPSGNPLRQLDAMQASLFNRFDPSGGIPFVFVAGRYVAQLPYSPGLLENRTFEQIKADVDSASPDQLGTAIDQEADVITALICSGDAVQPEVVCNAPSVQQLMAAIPT